MKVLFLTEGQHVPASRFRVQQFIPYLESRGIRCTVRPLIPNKYLSLRNRWAQRSLTIWKIFQRLRAIADASSFDAVYLQRDLIAIPSPFLERLLHRINPRLVFDFDDAITVTMDGGQDPRQAKVEEIFRRSQRIVAGNEYLRSLAVPHNSNITVIPTAVDTARYTPGLRPHGPLIIGWMGTAGNLPYLVKIAPALESLARQHSFELRIVSEAAAIPSELRGFNVRHLTWSESTELDDLRSFDIGIMPLPDNPWTRGKCGFKLLQYMAVGIPAVGSAVGVNREILANGAGLLADDETDWFRTLDALLSDANLRRRYGEAGRQRVVERYSIAANAPALEAVLREVADA